MSEEQPPSAPMELAEEAEVTSKKLNLDSKQETVFVHFFRSLPEKPPSTIQFFCRGDYYTVHGPDALFTAKEVFKGATVIKYMTSESSKRQLEYVALSKMNFEAFVRDLLLIKNYRVEVFTCPAGSSRSSADWTVEYKASPGNLTQFEDLLFSEGNIAQRAESLTGVVAVQVKTEDKNKIVGIGYLDIAQRKMVISQFPDSDSLANLEAVILQLGPRELLIGATSGENTDTVTVKEIAERCCLMVTERKRSDFNADEGFMQDMGRLLNIKKGQIESVRALPEIMLTTATPCLAACIRYLELVNDSTNFDQFSLSQYDPEQYVRVDGTTVKAVNLRPSPNASGIGKPYESLLGLFGQHICTPQGVRLLSRWLQQPLRDVALLEERQDIVEALRNDSVAMETLSKDYLCGVPDLRALARKVQRKKATLQDLHKIYQGVHRLNGVINTLAGLDVTGQAKASLKALLLDPLNEYCSDMEVYVKMIESTLDLNDIMEGVYRIKPSFDENLQDLNERIEEQKESMQKCLRVAARDIGLEAGKSIKLEHNSQWGYVFKVTMKDEKKMREKVRLYEALDTNKSGVRFVDSELRSLNEDYIATSTEYEEQQRTLVVEIVNIAASYCDVLCKLSDVLAYIDVLNSFAMTVTSARQTYVRPKLLPPGLGVLRFSELRHPCIELIDSLEFVPNNVDFNEEKCRMKILTGPNMGGKSTYIRSIGAAVIMAQIGSFVPADEAELSLVDAVLARVGAGDCQARGISTFMAEMLETSAILRVATQNSLIIVDELGRGTSTYDGFGLAWSIAEHIVTNVRAFCLFATHFHELTAMSQTTPGVLNYHVTAETSGDHLTLLYRVKPGVCDKSFGVHVARMAGFPEAVLKSAEKQQAELELQHKWVPSMFSVEKDPLREEAEKMVNKFFQDVQDLIHTTADDADLWTHFEKLKAPLLVIENPHIQEILHAVQLQDEPMECS